MKCVKCKRKAGINLRHLGGCLCNTCFTEVIKKRVRKAFREHDWLRPGDKAIIIDDSTMKAQAVIFLTKAVFTGLPFYFTIRRCKIPAQTSNKKIIAPFNLDDTIELHLKAMFDGKKPAKIGFITPLINISDEEIEYLAKANKLEGKKQEKTRLGRMLDDLEKKYPGSKFGLLKSFVSQ
ncbi:MAG: hypothetical protein QW666_03635 [Candidatus Woesearchaeota archaeon]